MQVVLQHGDHTEVVSRPECLLFLWCPKLNLARGDEVHGAALATLAHDLDVGWQIVGVKEGHDLANLAGFGLTTLPKDPQLLENRIQESRRSFERLTTSSKSAANQSSERPGGEIYLFVLEDLHTGKIVGTSAIVSKVGGFEPFYAYKIETTVAESDVLNVKKEIRYLKLVTEHNGPCEVGSLFLNPE